MSMRPHLAVRSRSLTGAALGGGARSSGAVAGAAVADDTRVSGFLRGAAGSRMSRSWEGVTKNP